MYTSNSFVYRATVTYSNTSTGQIVVRIPSLIGAGSVIELSKIGRSSSNDIWVVPKIGEQIIVTADDANFTNTFWLQTDPFNPGTKEPTGFSDRLDSVITFNNTTRVFTIAPLNTHYEVWVRGVKYVITESKSITIPNVTDGYSISFNAAGELQYTTTYFDLEWEAPISYVYWRSVASTTLIFSDERHGTTMDWQTHEYFHRTQGAVYANGFDVATYSTTGISIQNGSFFDEDLEVRITHSATPTLNTWEQRLVEPAYIPVFYLNSLGWEKTTAIDRPVYMATTRPYWNDLTIPGITEMSNGHYSISWILATNNLNEPVIAIMGQAEYVNIGDAEEALWDEISLENFPVYESRPLYKVIFRANPYTVIEVLDLREYVGLAGSGGSLLTTLVSLTDVLISSPQVGQPLIYDGADWTNAPLVPGIHSGTTYTVNGTDGGRLVQMTNASANIVYVPTDATYNYAVGTRIDIVQAGTGKTQVLATTPGTTAIRCTPGNYLRAQWSSASLMKLAANEWLLVGDLSAS